MSVRAIKSLLKGVPPSVNIRAEIARKLTEDYTPSTCHSSHEDEAEGLADERALFVRLYRGDDLTAARSLCLDSFAALASGDNEGRVIWACNLSLLMRDAEDNAGALALLILVQPFAENASPLTLAKWHNGLGRTYELLNRPDDALREYEDAFRILTFINRPLLAAHPLSNIGRVKASEGKVDEARMYLDRAARIAIDAGDYRLLGEIAEEGAKL